MRLGGRRSTNIEDRRGLRPAVVGGGLGSIVLLVLALFFGVDPSIIVGPESAGVNETVPSNTPAADDATKEFVSIVMGYTEDTWTDIFNEQGRSYREPKLVLFTQAVESACGFAQAAVGPFYCPPDESVYLDASFFQELRDRFQSPGDFAQAYVIAHEVGHHVQNLLGISEQVQAAQNRSSAEAANAASVKLELQADCLAGVWANRTQQAQSFLDPGDIEEALGAASMIGDDRLQMKARGYVVPESFTHGTAEQRARWFKNGFASGALSSCNTFQAANP